MTDMSEIARAAVPETVDRAALFEALRAALVKHMRGIDGLLAARVEYSGGGDSANENEGLAALGTAGGARGGCSRLHAGRDSRKRFKRGRRPAVAPHARSREVGIGPGLSRLQGELPRSRGP